MPTVNTLEFRGNYSATSNNIKLVRWPLMGGLLHWYSMDGTGRDRSLPRPLLAGTIRLLAIAKQTVFVHLPECSFGLSSSICWLPKFPHLLKFPQCSLSPSSICWSFWPHQTQWRISQGHLLYQTANWCI